jgi:hypothetical protein
MMTGMRRIHNHQKVGADPNASPPSTNNDEPSLVTWRGVDEISYLMPAPLHCQFVNWSMRSCLLAACRHLR